MACLMHLQPRPGGSGLSCLVHYYQKYTRTPVRSHCDFHKFFIYFYKNRDRKWKESNAVPPARMQSAATHSSRRRLKN